MDRIELEVTNREVLGKKVKHLRRQGITPVHLFGHGVQSLALQCDTDKVERLLAQAGRTGLINLRLDEEKEPRTVVCIGDSLTACGGADGKYTDYLQER